ncbi:MarR family transcriptional regulator [Loktanella sp. IMCC34160]|uniref:MarR family winged helix-turn-helix transcriptional regulator n=1 Tax=Loktanella sp. IMCC34160 TaxID=2510646 RepID=UPI00101CAE1D|nr:MarR family transcriptional regulator [Loktanella sp. IMCC34160]RYG90304.1 MarR family transcriptional regulator [Loktanella sp. IMCC34160]
MKLETFFPYRLAVAAEAFSRNLTDVYGREFGLTREEWRLLFLLADEEEVTSLELARRTTLDKVQVSRASLRLEEKGLITRSVSDTDRRLRIYRCTEKGSSLFEAALAKVEERARLILDAMPAADRDALSRGLDALVAAVGTVHERLDGDDPV